MTSEEFVMRPKTGPGILDYGRSKYDKFREKIAEKLSVPVGNVHIFTVMNHPSMERTTDVRFAAHGSPYYRPARLDGIVNQFKDEVRKCSLQSDIFSLTTCIFTGKILSIVSTFKTMPTKYTSNIFTS